MIDTSDVRRKSHWIVNVIITAWEWIRQKITEWGAMNGKK